MWVGSGRRGSNLDKYLGAQGHPRANVRARRKTSSAAPLVQRFSLVATLACGSAKTIRKDHQIVEHNHGACQSQCGRPYNNCTHRCMRRFHGEESCPSCEAPCEVQRGHSKCHNKYQEPCARALKVAHSPAHTVAAVRSVAMFFHA